MRKKLFISILLLFLSFMFFNSKIYAFDLADLDISLNEDTGFVSINQYTGENKYTQTDAWNRVYVEYKDILVGISGLLTLTFIILFMKNIFNFGKSAGNPQEKSKYMNGILWTGIGCGGFAMVTVIMALAFKFLR